MHVPPHELLLVIGRLLLGGIFVFAGIRHLFIIPMVSQVMAQRGVPAPRLVLVSGTVFQVAGGLLLILGLVVPIAALGLVIFTIAASVMLLNFWSLEGAAREGALNGWLSNLGVIGGLLIAAAYSI
jgi:putative oxidoreductase